MEPRNDRIAKRLAEIRAQGAELDRLDAENAAAAEPGAVVVEPRRGNWLRSALFLIGLLLLAAGLLGLAVTFSRLAGDDIGDATRIGQAQVTTCIQRGPITNKGFGYWHSCTATITWADGDVDRVTAGAVFSSDDVGKSVRVGDLGRYRTSPRLVSADVSPRPWLDWIGYAVTVVAFVPTLVGTLIVRELLRFRR